MSTSNLPPLEPLDPELRELLEARRATWGGEAAPLAAKARVMTRVEVSLVGAAGGAAAAGRLGRWPFAAHPHVLVLAGTFAAGIGVGAAAMKWTTPAAPVGVSPVSIVAREPVPSRPTEPDLPALPVPAPATQTAATPTPSVAPAQSSGGAATSSDDGPAERLLLDQARAAERAGDHEGALSPLLEHARRFPRGRLTEEREALVVLALARGGRAAEARARGARFEQQYPGSLFFAAVKDALASISDK
jgi:hypothetical protein